MTNGKGRKTMIEIVKTYRQSLPALRFIGKRYTDADRDQHGGYGKLWGEWFQQNAFAPLEQMGSSPEHGDAYLGLMTMGGGFAYWIGMFMPAGTEVPEGYACLDVPACDVGICWIRGREANGEIYGQHAHDLCVHTMKEAGYEFAENAIFFERYNCPRFTTPDAEGKVILDYGIAIKPEA